MTSPEYTARDRLQDDLDAEAWHRANRCADYWESIRSAAQAMRVALDKLKSEGMARSMFAYECVNGEPVEVWVYVEELDDVVTALSRMDVKRTMVRAADDWVTEQMEARW